MAVIKHFTVTVLVVYKNKVLLHRHKKLGIWIPVGGHIEENELPEETVVREAREEAGLEIKLYNPDQDNLGCYNKGELLIKPVHIELHKIKEDHFHINLVYYGRTGSDEIKPSEQAKEGFKWFSRQKLSDKKIAESVKFVCEEALEILGD